MTTLEEIVNKIKDTANQWGQDKLAIWGGQCAEDKVLNFLQNWKLKEMPYRLWEYVSEIEFVKGSDTLPDDKLLAEAKISLLEHGRLFGPGGDLTLRRDGMVFRWHFIGQKTQPEPPTSGNPKDFWVVEANQGLKFHKWENKALLWGEYKKELGRWHDDRVARARLDYPTPNGEKWPRVSIKYYTFSQAGQVQFIWFRELVPWKKEEQNGNGNN